MQLTLNEEQEMLKNSVRGFLANECTRTVLAELERSETGFSRKLWDAMAGLGWMGVLVPEACGGSGLSLLDQAVLFEEVGRAALNGPMPSTVLGTLAVLEGGDEGMKAKRLPDLAAGKTVTAFAMEEPGVAFAPRFVAARAEAGDGGYVLTGTKLFVPYASVADDLLVVARTAGEPGQERGVTLFRVAGKAPGLGLAPMKSLAGDKPFQVDLDAVPVSPGDVLGSVNEGLPLVSSLLERATALQCAEMVGGAAYELEITAEHGRTREQFNRPIGTFQAVQHRLADMYMDVLGARLTTYQAVWRLSEGLPAAREVAIAKVFTNHAARRVAFSAQQIHAGMGYDLDHTLHYYYRRQKAFELKMGSSPVQMERLASVLGL